VRRVWRTRAWSIYLHPRNDAVLIGLPCLHVLDISGCAGVMDEGVAALRNLHALNINHCERVTDAGVVALSKLHALKLGQCELVTDDCVAGLRIAGVNVTRCTPTPPGWGVCANVVFSS